MFYFKSFSKTKAYKILEARLFACLMPVISPKGTDAKKDVKLACFPLETISDESKNAGMK